LDIVEEREQIVTSDELQEAKLSLKSLEKYE